MAIDDQGTINIRRCSQLRLPASFFRDCCSFSRYLARMDWTSKVSQEEYSCLILVGCTHWIWWCDWDSRFGGHAMFGGINSAFPFLRFRISSLSKLTSLETSLSYMKMNTDWGFTGRIWTNCILFIEDLLGKSLVIFRARYLYCEFLCYFNRTVLFLNFR